MIRGVRCYVVTCDDCRVGFDESDAAYIVHFDTETDAVNYIAEHGWFIDTNGETRCPECWTRRLCAQVGHTYTTWQPCACQGTIPDHHTNGCGLWRACEQQHCWFHEDTTFADLPTTDEPHIPGR